MLSFVKILETKLYYHFSESDFWFCCCFRGNAWLYLVARVLGNLSCCIMIIFVAEKWDQNDVMTPSWFPIDNFPVRKLMSSQRSRTQVIDLLIDSFVYSRNVFLWGDCCCGLMSFVGVPKTSFKHC